MLFRKTCLDLPETCLDCFRMLPEQRGGAGDRALLLVEAFRNATRPCIVKFRSTKPREDVVRVALFYAYSTLWGQEQCIETNTCFAGEGRTIPVEDIVQVEYLT